MKPSRMEYDAVVAGGGPAGAAAAAVIAQRGYRVLLAERAAEPQFKVGESLMPATYWTMERIGALPKMKASRFVQKHSVQFYNRMGKASAPFYFAENDPHESAQTWQVLRSEFDQLLLDSAAEQGAEVRRGLAVREVKYGADGEVVGLELETAAGEAVALSTPAFVDATGQTTLLARHLNLKQVEPRLRNASYFTHFEGAYRDSGLDEGATLVMQTEAARSWFWYIPLANNIVSVGVVGPVDYMVQGRPGDPQAVFLEELARCQALVPRLANARQVMPMKVIRDFSYRARNVSGKGWVLVGDALGFIDPIYSSGVFLALQSGEWAGDAVADGLAVGDLSAARLGAWGPRLTEGMEALRRLVYAFYDPEFSFSRFLKRFPEHRGDIINMLVGDVFRKPLGDVLAALAETTQNVPEAYAS